MTIIRRFTFASNLDPTLPKAIEAPAITPTALYLPSSWDDSAKSWRDLSGNGFHLSKILSGTVDPQKVDSFVRFPASAHMIGNTLLKLPQPYTAAVLFRVPNARQASGRLVPLAGKYDNVPNIFLPGYSNSGSVAARVDTTDLVGPTVADSATSFADTVTVMSGSSSRMFVNGGKFSGSLGTNAIDGVRVAMSNGGGIVPVTLDVGAVVIIPSALSDSQVTDLRSYLRRVTGLA